MARSENFAAWRATCIAVALHEAILKGADGMRILIDILHPAHVHFFRPFIGEMQARGHEIRVTSVKVV